jgi:hypothetical protein
MLETYDLFTALQNKFGFKVTVFTSFGISDELHFKHNEQISRVT